MVTAPEESGGKQEVVIVNLTDLSGKTPDYLKDYLLLKGMNLKEILLPSASFPSPSVSLRSNVQEAGSLLESWPRDKGALIDALLKNYEVTFSSAQQFSIVLREGIRLDTMVDRIFEFGGKKVALVFHVVSDEVKRALQEREGIKAVDLDLPALSSREVISRLLEALGEKTTYREHRFPAIEGGAKDKMVVSLSGFFVAKRSLFLTDREIPKGLQRFFAEKGLRLVRFQ